MKQDKFLVGILAFIGLLVAAALILFFVRKGTTAYQPGDTPEHVVFNFALAIQQNDLERAYGYMADREGKPTLSAFLQSAQNGSLGVNGNALQVGQATLQGQDNATVAVTVQFLGSGPFDNGYSNQDHATLVRQNGAWKILSMPFPYWAYDWYPVTTAVPAVQP